MGNSIPPSDYSALFNVTNGKRDTSLELSESIYRVSLLLQSSQYTRIVSDILRIEDGDTRYLDIYTLSRAQEQSIQGGTIYAPLGSIQLEPSSTIDDKIATTMMKQLITNNTALYGELTTVPLIQWNLQHVGLARKIISIDCIRKYGKPAKLVSNEILNQRFIKLLNHFHQIERLVKEDSSVTIKQFTRRATEKTLGTPHSRPAKKIRRTVGNIQRILDWFGINKGVRK